MWFVRFILFCYFITPLLILLRNWLTKKDLKIQLVILAAVTLTVEVFCHLINFRFLPTGNWMVYVVGFFFAYYYSLYGDKFFNTSNYISWILAFLINGLILFATFGNLQHYTWLDMGKSDVLIKLTQPSTTLFKLGHTFLGLGLFLILFRFFRGIKMNKVLEYSDKYSYHVYLVHTLFIFCPISILAFESINPCLLVVGVYILSGITAIILQKLASFRFSLFMKKNINN